MRSPTTATSTWPRSKHRARARSSSARSKSFPRRPRPAPGGVPTRAGEARLVVAAALVKFDRFEWMIEKATELGVDAIVPFAAARSERGLDAAARKRAERWRRIALEASQQSRRARVPAIEAPARFEDVLAAPADRRFVLDEDPEAPPLIRALPESRRNSDTIAVLLGPEGGWSDPERECFASWTRVSLGPRILRAETAAVAALAILRAAWDLR